jgi:hypothetical protein
MPSNYPIYLTPAKADNQVQRSLLKLALAIKKPCIKRADPIKQHIVSILVHMGKSRTEKSSLSRITAGYGSQLALSFIIMATGATSMSKLQRSHSSFSRGSPLLPNDLASLCCSLLLRTIPSNCSPALQASSGENLLP